MTKSTITREESVQAIFDLKVGYRLGFADIEILKRVASIALAAMDSEPVELPLDYLQGHKDGLEWAAQLAEANHPETGDWLYDDPIELAKAIRKGPDMPLVQPVADSEPVAEITEDLGRLFVKIHYPTTLKAGDKLYRHAQPAPVVEREPIAWLNDAYLARGVVDGEVGSEDAGPGYIPVYREAGPQPAPVVPEEKPIPNTLSMYAVDAVAAIAEVKGWNACRAAMLQASPVCTCPSGDGSLRWPCPVHPGNSPAQSDCCPAQNSVNPAQGGNYLVIPDEMTSEQAYEIGYYYGDPVDVFARGANWMRQHIIDSTLAAAPQSPGSEPATVPGKWIPVSERMPERGDYLVTDGCDFDVQLFNGEQFIPGFVWEDKITHWMPLPAAPQEVKGE
ncbi:Eaa1 [Klebsiella pneumoniae]|nr:Eaa1 [Klebsiella pneumoniae]